MLDCGPGLVFTQLNPQAEGGRALLQQVAVGQVNERPCTWLGGRRQAQVGAYAGRFTRGQRDRSAGCQSRSST
jgi:hypothetical protein